MIQFALALAALLMAGCASGAFVPYNLTSGILPSVDCDGKATMVFTGGAVGAANVTANMVCEKFHLQQLQPAAPAAKP